MTGRQWLGAALLTLTACALVIYLLWPEDDPPNPDPLVSAPTEVPDPITVVGYGGNIKVPFLRNPEVVAILKNRYGITVDVEASDTQRMLCDVPLDGVDFLWAGDQSQIQTYEECRERSDFYRNVVLTPLVIYSWTDSTNALIDAGVVRTGSDGVYRVDMVALLDLIESGQSWNDLGFQNRPSSVIVKTTDPNESTSGQLFSGLLANTMNCMEVVNSSTVEAILPSIHDYFERLGFMPTASLELFRLYVSTGEGSHPLVALLESQSVEFALSNPELVQEIQDEIRILYPEPTAWLTNPMIGLTDGGRRLTEAMLDPEIQQLGWEKNGFRPSVPGVQINLAVLPIPGVPEEIDSVIDVPSNPIMDRVLDAARPEYVPDPNAPPRRVCEPGSTPAASPVAVRDD
jgi:hypothetical protein